MARTGEAALWDFDVAIAAGETFLPPLGSAVEDRIGSNAQCVLDTEKLTELVEQRQSDASIAAQLDGRARKNGLQPRYQPKQHRNNARMGGSIAGPQPHAE